MLLGWYSQEHMTKRELALNSCQKVKSTQWYRMSQYSGALRHHFRVCIHYVRDASEYKYIIWNEEMSSELIQIQIKKKKYSLPESFTGHHRAPTFCFYFHANVIMFQHELVGLCDTFKFIYSFSLNSGTSLLIFSKIRAN